MKNPALRTVLAAASALAGVGTASAEEPAVVKDPYVLTDQSVDGRTVDSILKGLIKGGMSDEEKVLAVFHWIRRLIYHGDGPVQYAYNFHHILHIYGHGSCLRQTTPMWVLLDRLGYKCRNGAIGGHHIIEVQYGGKWHLLDPHMTFYVYDRAKPPTIASIEQIKADTTLVSDAVKEGRACPGFLLCGDPVSTFATRSGWKEMGNFPESRKYTPVIEEPFGRITLRRGETYVRTWMPGPYWFKANWYRKDEGPRHGCGRRDSQDTVNWPIYEPHAYGTKYRHWGAGHLLYKPDLATGHYADAVVQQTNLEPGRSAREAANMVALADHTKPGEVVFSVGCPYVVTAGELKLRRIGRGDLAAAVSTDRGKTFKPIQLIGEADVLRATFVDEVNGSLAGYWLKVSVPPGSAFADLELTSHFQLNPYSLPYLIPGRNVVSVEAAGYGSPLTVTWNWSEGEDWKTPKSVTRTLSANGSFEVETQGPKYPRMESLVLAVAP